MSLLEELKRRKVFMVILALAVGFLFFDRKKGSEPFFEEKRALTPFSLAPFSPSVAVLPFVAISNGPDDDYFSDGLTEEIINALAQFPELLVTARTSAFHFKGQNLPLEEIAGQLGVGHIVKGSVHRAGEQLRITAQLISAEDGSHIWSKSYDRQTEDTFAVQSDIAEKVATALNVVLDEKQRTRLRQAGIRNVEAYTAYQKGLEAHKKAHGIKVQIPYLREGNRHFEDAFALAPDFSDAYLNHADLYIHILMTQASGQLDGNITEADIQAAPAAMTRDYDQATRHARNSAQRLIATFDQALLLGQWNGLAALSKRALRAPGCEPALWAYLGGTAFGQAQLVADAYARRAACDPILMRTWIRLADAQLWLGQPGLGVETIRNHLNSEHQQRGALTYIYALAISGEGDIAKQFVDTEINSKPMRLIASSSLAAINGDAASAKSDREQYIASSEADDLFSLVLFSQLGNHFEANRLAGLIDQRPFGYMVLMQAVYYCACGAPFDLKAAPDFASRFSDSGLPWPPRRPIEFPLKDW